MQSFESVARGDAVAASDIDLVANHVKGFPLLYTLKITTDIAAPPSVCFDLARSVDAHVASAVGTGERVVGGKTTGLLELGDEVTWEGKHFGVTQRRSSRITQLRSPFFFQDRMTRGAFHSLEHDPYFESKDVGTVMTDVLSFAAPLGLVGWVAERSFLARHLRRFLVERGVALKQMAKAQVTDHTSGG